MKLLNFGSLNIDRVFKVPYTVKPGESLASPDPILGAGGKGLNQSVAAVRAGLEVYHAGKIGNDGLFLLDVLKGSGVNTDNVIINDSILSGGAYIQVEPDGKNTMLICPGANKSLTEKEIRETLDKFSPDDIILLQNETNLTSFIAKEAKNRGMKVAYNPSPITDVVFEMDYSLIDFLIVNEDEAQSLCGALSSPNEMIQKLKLKCPGTIVITMGKNGSYGTDGSSIEYVPAYTVDAVDSTGAGDTFTGYFLCAVSEGKDIKEAMRLSAKASAIAVTKIGAAASIPLRKAVEDSELE